LSRKFETARAHVPAPVLSGNESAEIGLIAYGSTDAPMKEAMDQLSAKGVAVEYLRVRGFPFPRQVHDFVARKKRVYVIEQNRDAQMLQLLKLDLKPELLIKLRSILHYNGLPVDAKSVSDDILRQEG
jgi:2-oxoglutarate ferredoxin oxidoreductase subunit alpha